jgi:hypothetical protein
MNSTTFINSTIFTQEQGNALLNLVNLPSSSVITKIYRASIDGFGLSTFHSKCDSILGTLTIIKTINKNVFGGFTKANWDSHGNKPDNASFVFSVDKFTKYPIQNNF